MRALLAAADRQNLGGRERVRQVSEVVLPLAELPSEEAAAVPHAVVSRDLPKAGCWRGLRYQGDWMLRPIASNEVAPLVRLLVGVSRAVNSSLGLTGVPAPPGEGPPETVTQVCCCSRAPGEVHARMQQDTVLACMYMLRGGQLGGALLHDS
eukprot:GHRQ01028202.1.p2 GENE.GHRQ01028202.1~~GHRQ01028202.1.p2  ORF type:complete len:152 (+),score=68.35 GHRQ01028202.1:152-607(+)